MMIITDIDFLRKPCEPITSKEEANKIIGKLWPIVKKYKARGLAANQIGILKRVCVIQGTRPVALVNPIITFKSEATLMFREQCLSLPGVTIYVERPIFIEVIADNYRDKLTFDTSKKIILGGKTLDVLHFDSFTVQHEIDHLDGKLITDYSKDDETQKE